MLHLGLIAMELVKQGRIWSNVSAAQTHRLAYQAHICGRFHPWWPGSFPPAWTKPGSSTLSVLVGTRQTLLGSCACSSFSWCVSVSTWRCVEQSARKQSIGRLCKLCFVGKRFKSIAATSHTEFTCWFQENLQTNQTGQTSQTRLLGSSIARMLSPLRYLSRT